MTKVTLLNGDCLQKLKELEDNSVDAVVTDPPYGLEFMGKEWDSFKTGRIAKYKEGGSIDLEAIESRKGKGGAGPSYTKRAAKRCRTCGKQEWSGSPCKCDNPDFEIDNSTQLTFQEFSEAWAKECYRVLKPGGHLLAFAGSRMYHRLAVGVEDAGFEIRDQIMWIYGSGFPKSHNIGKSVDKIGGNSIGWFGEWLKEWREENNIPQSKIAKLFPSKTGGLTGCVSNWELGKNIPTLEEYNKIVEEFDLPFKSLEELEREVIGKKNSACFGNEDRHTIGASKSVEVDITKGNTEWEGWGTALKPAHEPIVMARKPFKGNVANNVLEWGTGGINVDGCRIGYRDENDKNSFDIRRYDSHTSTFQSYEENNLDKTDYKVEQPNELGRFPANIIFDEEAGKILDEQSGNKTGQRGIVKGTEPSHSKKNSIYGDYSMVDGKYAEPKDGLGGASRFFYCPKASKKDRDEGCDGLPQKANVFMSPDSRMNKDQYERTSPGMERFKTEPKSNFHPTVKPTDLMAYLIRLITPKGGLVLDPFMGSGSTGKAAVREGMDFIGIEREEEYMEIAKSRIEWEQKKNKHRQFFDV